MIALKDWQIELPTGPDLNRFLQLSCESKIEDLLEKSLTAPLMQILSRPGKNLRASLVQLGFDLVVDAFSLQERELCMKHSMAVLELLHTGSLVIDDIQDGSLERRGLPAIHRLYGVPIALNAGNWLYFLPFHIIDSMPISDTCKHALSKEVQSTLLRGHYGQALDVGVAFDSIARERLSEVSTAIIELKTGALSSLAFKMGALAGNVDPSRIQTLDRFGRSFGMALQMYDDIGNLSSASKFDKWCEDLRLKRVTFSIATAADTLSEQDFQVFLELCKSKAGPDPEQEAKKFLLQKEVAENAKKRADLFLSNAVHELQQKFSLTETQLIDLKGLQRKLMSAYD